MVLVPGTWDARNRECFRCRMALGCSPAGEKVRQVNRCVKLKRTSVDATERRDLRAGEGFPEEVTFLSWV